MVAGPSNISGNRPLGPENSSPTSDRLSDVKFGTNLDVLAEITVPETIIGKVTNHRTRYKMISQLVTEAFPFVKCLYCIYLDIVGYQQWCLRKYLFFSADRGFLAKENGHFQIIISQRNPHIINEILFLDANSTSIFLSQQSVEIYIAEQARKQ